MVAVMAPRPSILTRQESMKVEVVIAGLSSASKVALPPDGSRQAAMPMPASLPSARSRSRSALELFVAGIGQHLVDDGLIVAAVVSGAARDQIGKLVVPDQVAPAHLERIEAQHIRDLVHAALEREIGRPLAEAAHRVIGGLVGHDRDGAVLHAFDLVGPDDGADRLAELERRAAGIGADILQRAHLHRAHDALVVERDFDIEQPLRPMRVAAAHVFQPVLDQPDRKTQPPRQIAAQHRVLDAALDAVAAADIDVVMHAHRGGRNFQRHADLVGIARHLDRGIDVEHFAPRVPARHHAEGLDRHGRRAAPFHPQHELARAGGEILVDLAPDESLVEQHIGAVRLVHQRRPVFERLFGVEHEGQRLVVDLDGFGRVFGQRAAYRPPRRRPIRPNSARHRAPKAGAARSA